MSEQVTFTLPIKGGDDGSLTVTVINATEQSGYVQDEGEEYSSRKEWVEAAAMVDGEIKVRGIWYDVKGVAYRWLRVARPVYVDRKETEDTTHWQWDHKETRYDGGYRRRDSAKKVDSGTATDKYIDGVVEQTLAAFNEAHPDWQRESFRMRLEYKIRYEEGQAEGKRKEALEYDERANRWRLELEKL